jgi:LCP family protein required for cell wall assembly
MGRADPRAAAAAALSFLFPGLGQAYNQRWHLAALLAAPMALVVALAAAIAVADGRTGLSGLVDTKVLVAIVVLDVGLLGWRVVAILQAHTERSRLSSRGWPRWLTAALVVLAVAMHAVPAMYALTAIETLSSVSLEGDGSAFGDRDADAIVMPRPSDQPELGERITVLLVGIDLAPGRTQQLTDTLLVASLDPQTGEGAMVSIPRDLYGVPLGDGRTYDAKLNSLLSTASADPITYPRGGPATLKAAIAELLQTRIHYIAAIDMQGMRQLIDGIGGVDVVVERAIDDPRYRDALTGTRGFFIEAGPHHLDGETAMAYVRSRMAAGENDFTRAARQQQVLKAIAQKLAGGNLLLSLPTLLNTVRDNVSTDIPSVRMSTVAAAVERADLDGIENVVLTPEDGYVIVDAFSSAGYVLYPALDAIRDMAARTFE